jgi:hypothetical protein
LSPTVKVIRMVGTVSAADRDLKGNLAEGMGGNIFVVRGAKFYTPSERYVRRAVPPSPPDRFRRLFGHNHV